MKIIQAGLGNFGAYWFTTLKKEYPDLEIVAVDQDPDKAAGLLTPRETFYTSLEKALEKEKPDFILNVTPPHVHTQINNIAFDHGLPVLCEKPIATDYNEAVAVVRRAEYEGLPFMIAENYRRMPLVRRTRKLLESGAIGELTSIHIDFYQTLREDKAYLVAMPDPLLVDVAIHHLDMVRYLIGSEVDRIFAHSYHTRGSFYPGNAALMMAMEMENGVTVSFNGNLTSYGAITDWIGDWRIEGTHGILLLGKNLQIIEQGKVKRISTAKPSRLCASLEDFLTALTECREPESSGKDYLKTQCLVHHAQISSKIRRMVEVEYPLIDNNFI